jgi:Leucine-rich repeat (LRR) protein
MMNENRISSIPSAYIKSLRKLVKFSINRNKLASLPENLDVMVQLEYFDVSNNALFLLPEASSRARMPLLKDFIKDGNPCERVKGGEEGDDEEEEETDEDEEGEGDEEDDDEEEEDEDSDENN